MRIISGIYGGRRFPENIPSKTRPTSDKTRESIFNILNNIIDFEDLKVLDLYAGTGALGFESLSRGAESCTFIDKGGQSISFIKKFIKILNINDSQLNIIKQDALKYIENTDKKFDLIFADPPYALLHTNKLLDSINSNEILNDEGLFVVEHSIKEVISINKNWHIIKAKNFGQTSFEIMELE